VTVFTVGEMRQSQGRTISEADILTWAGLVHDFTTLHVDAETTASLFFGERIAHGSIAWSLSVGLFFPTEADWYTAHNTVRSTGWKAVRFTNPVKIGDTIRCRRTVTDVVSEDGQVKSVEHQVEVRNQRGELVMTGLETMSAIS
jgi:acyl dehydratase